MVHGLLSFDLQRANRTIQNAHNEQTLYNRICELYGACRVLCSRQSRYRKIRSLGGHFNLPPEEIGQTFSVLVATPDGKGYILSVVLWEQTWPASCRLQSLTSFPFP